MPNTAPQKGAPKTIKDGFSFAATGDLLGPYRPRSATADPELEEVLKLMRGADVTFANMESSIFDLHKFNGSPGAENGSFAWSQMDVGGGPLMVASVARYLKEQAGIDMVSIANNHATDWGLEGMRETTRHLDEAGIVHAGSGRTRAEARAPAFLETSHGRVALVSTASTVMPMSVAGPGAGVLAPRPGISALRLKTITLVTESEMAALRVIAARQGRVFAADAKELTLNPNDQIFQEQTFRVSERPGMTYEMNPVDRDEILAAVQRGKQLADWTVLAIHAHETESGGQEYVVNNANLFPADFLSPLFHAAIDAGADIVITHGPHALRGVEIYKGKPIFYGLDQIFYEGASAQPAGFLLPESFDSVVAVIEFQGKRPATVRLHPIDLGRPEAARAHLQQGIPNLPSPSEARRILKDIQDHSTRYGTRIQIENNVGVIHIEDR